MEGGGGREVAIDLRKIAITLLPIWAVNLGASSPFPWRSESKFILIASIEYLQVIYILAVSQCFMVKLDERHANSRGS